MKNEWKQLKNERKDFESEGCGMDLKELEQKMNDFVVTKGWYQSDSPKPQTPKNIALSLVLEASEVLEHFQWGEEITDQEALGAELADVALYLLQLSHLAGIDLEQSILKKLEKNYKRNWD